MRRFGRLTIMVVILIIPVAGNAAAANESPQPSHYLAIMRQQESLHPIVEALLAEVATLPAPSGFTSIAFEGNGLTLYWRGEPPSTVLRTAPSVRVVRAPFSAAELDAAAARIESGARAGGAISDIQAIETRGDGTGLTVTRMAETIFAGVRAHAAQSPIVTAEQAIVSADVTIPVTLNTATTAIIATSSRIDDSTPFNGGTRYTNFATAGKCTTGFGVVRNGQTFILTAGHCVGPGQQLFDGEIGKPSFSPMNTVYLEDWDKDIALVNTRGYHRMFDGPPTTSTYKNVYGWGSRVTGELLCQSGSSSGTVCGLQTTNVTNGVYLVTDSDGDTFYVHGMSTARQLDGRLATRPGDSGGPVFSLLNNGVRAKGVVSGNLADTTLIYQDWGDIGASLSAYPVIAP